MIRKYMMERRSWIMLFVGLQLLSMFIAYLDPEITPRPILYISFLSWVIFILFLVARYRKETKFIKSLEDWENNLDLTSIAAPSSPFERIIERSVVQQTNQLKWDASQQRLLLEQEKDDLMAWIHEVKTPLTAMRLMIDRLEDKTAKSQLIYEWLRIHLLLDQQLHQKRIPFMENDLYIEKSDLEAIVVGEIKTLQSWCMQKGIGFDLELDVTEVLSDSKWLAFILRQIVTNAIKYSEASDIIIRSGRGADRRIWLEVQDFGRGIDPRDLPRIFDKGFTSTLQHQDQAATGMGLYLVRQAARPLQIRVDVQSKLGEGTTIRLTFPAANEFVHISGV